MRLDIGENRPVSAVYAVPALGEVGRGNVAASATRRNAVYRARPSSGNGRRKVGAKAGDIMSAEIFWRGVKRSPLS